MKPIPIIFLSALFLLFSCASYKDNVRKVPSKETKVSKTIQESPERFLKRKVAIARFTNETKYSKGFFYDGSNDLVAKQAMDILSAKLTATDKFILLERSDIEMIKKELNMADIDKLKVNADYLVIGSVSEFGRNTTGKKRIFTSSKKQTAYAKVNIRLVDVYSGQIIYSEEGEGEAFSEVGTVMGIGGKAGYNSSINDKAISAAISKLVGNIVENLLEKPWRSFILDFENGTYIISGGKSQGIKAGDIFNVYKKGKKVKNPQTNMMVELPGQQIGRIKVQNMTGDTPNNEVSFCIKQTGDLPVSDFSEYYIQEVK